MPKTPEIVKYISLREIPTINQIIQFVISTAQIAIWFSGANNPASLTDIANNNKAAVAYANVVVKVGL